MRVFFIFIGVSIFQYTFSCDFCGAYMGITPYDNQSGISILYRYKSFNGYPYKNQKTSMFPSTRTYSNCNSNFYSNVRHGNNGTALDSIKSPNDYEIYTSTELRAKYFIHPRIELNGILPFVVNYSQKNEHKQLIKGIGDITTFCGYHAIKKILTEKYQHRLIVGGGIKLPVGDYYQKNENNERIDYMLQPGTGSVDYLMYANYIFGYKKMGLNFNTILKMNGTNYYKERISNSSSTYLNLFYKLRSNKNLKLIPSIQFFYEYTKGLYVNSNYQEQTKMEIVNLGLGLDMFYKNLAINLSFQSPIYEAKFENNLVNSGRLMIGLTYSFNQTKYLLNFKKKE